MPLSRLENFLKNVEGNILYVNPDDLDATDSIENQGNSLTKPFKTIQRALLEAARFSYQVGQNNDKADRTTVLIYPGTHEVDNRPGFSVVNVGGVAQFRDRNGNVVSLDELTNASNYNLDDSTNELYKYNSVHGGVIVPRGTSLVGYDLRKTKIRPKFVPNPTDDAVDRASIFRLTGGCYIHKFCVFDGDPNGSVYKDYTSNRYTPSFSHHKLTVFEYADGVNGVGVGTSSTTTDLQMYFHKIQRAYGDTSGRALGEFPGTTDMEPKNTEYQIVAPVSASNVAITSIRAGAGSLSNTSTTVTVDCTSAHGLVVDSPVRIAGVNTYPDIYNGNFVVTGVSSDRIFTYRTSSAPLDGLPSLDGDEVVIADTDSTVGASPYIFNVSMRSQYGMCGLHADGSKASGFKSMLIAQFTGVGLQKDNNAFAFYNSTTGTYDTNATVAESAKPLYLNSNAVYRPSYENYHLKATNDAVLQAVSVFVIGYAQHFLAESGGDIGITNSNSNFGQRSLTSKGFRKSAFDRDNRGYITHIVPPQRLVKKDISVEWVALNVGLTTRPVGVGTTAKLFLDGYTDPDVAPPHVVDGYRIGARSNNGSPDLLKLNIVGVGTFSTPIRMLNFDGTEGPTGYKEYEVGRVGAANSIANSTLTLRSGHKLFAGESVRVISDDGFLPDGLDTNTIYYAVTDDSVNETLDADKIKLAKSENEALLGGSGNFITINNNTGGQLKILSRVSDKKPGDKGHPVQYDTQNSNWYVRGGISTDVNTLWTKLVDNQVTLGARTGKTFINRKEDTRSLSDKIYKLRYVIPKEYSDAKVPVPGFTIQESSTVGVTTATDFTNNITNATIQRNVRVIASVNRDSNTGITTFVTERPHNFRVGDEVSFLNIKSTGNTVGTGNSGFNQTRTVSGITSSKGFTATFSNDPGTFISDVSTRGANLPTVSRRTYKDSFTIYRVDTLKDYEANKQDGVYHLTCIDSSISPIASEFSAFNLNQNVTNLYPQFDQDNFDMDPSHSASFAVNTPVGKVVTNDLKKSITKEFTNNWIVGNRIGFAVTFAESSSAGISTIYTEVQHNLNTIIALGTPTAGTGYGPGIVTTLYNVHLTGGGGQGATANVVVSAASTVTSVTIVDGGSAYVVGNTLTIQAGNNDATVTVTKINNNIGDALQIVGVGSDRNRYDSAFNGIHTITSVTARTISYNNGINAGIYTGTSTGIHTGFAFLAGDAPTITNILYSNKQTGIATVTTSRPHGLNVNNPFKIVGCAQTIYNGEFVVNERVGVNTFTFKFTEEFNTDAYVSGGQVLPILYGSRGGLTVSGNEKIGQRHVPLSVGIGTTLSASGITTTATTLSLTDSSGFYKGDYVQIDGEILRVASDFASNQATVLRGQLGSRAESHDGASVASKIRIIPVENRRFSSLRASGHTFEYLGYGPGNYSTSLPTKQNRVLTKEQQFLAQSLSQNGGSIVYTGVNDTGDFYIGNRVINTQAGTEITFNIPVPTTTGTETGTEASSGRNDATFDSVNINEGLTVSGNNASTVKLNAPVQLTEKLTSTAADGLEVVSLDIKGALSQARTITYSSTKPTASGVEGDLVLHSNPQFGDYLGWVFTAQGWKRFGLISTEVDETKLSLTKVGIGSTSASRIGNQNGLDIRGQLIVDNVSIVGVSTISGTTSFQNVTFVDVNVSSAATVARLNVTGNANVGAAFTVTGIATFSNNVKIGGNLTVDGDINLDEGSFRNLNVTGVTTTLDLRASGLRVIGVTTSRSILPESNNTYDLGSSGTRFSNGYFNSLTVEGQTIDSTGVNIASGDTYKINTTSVLSATTLGSGVVNSSLTSVGNLTQLAVAGVTSIGNNLVVDTSTLYVDASTNRVGVNTANPQYPLDVVGDINISAGSFFKINGAVLTSGYFEPVTEGKAIGLTTAAGVGVACNDANFIGNGDGRASFQVGAGSSVLFVGAGTTARVGIGSTIPRAALDLAGKLAINGDPQWVDTYGVIKQSRANISEDVTIPAQHRGVNFNSMSIGPITIDSGYTVTVGTDAVWAIL